MSSAESSDLSDHDASPPPPADKPAGNRYDQMFASEDESENGDKGGRDEKRVKDEDGEDDEEGLEEDLFGEIDDEEPKKEDDGQLEDIEIEDEGDKTYTEFSLTGHEGPQHGHDGEIYLMRIPPILNMEPRVFDPDTFQLPTKDAAETHTSVYTLATTAVRIRKNPENPSELQSNARIVRWSDGTFSLQIASSPNLYDLPKRPLAPPHKDDVKYDPYQDSHTYLFNVQPGTDLLRNVAQATTSLGMQSAAGSTTNDDAVQALQEKLLDAAKQRGGRRNLEINTLNQLEENAKRAEAAQREKDRMNRKLENQRRRARDRDPLGMDAPAQRRPTHGRSGTRSKRDSPPIGRGGRKEDEYDLEDDFIEGSEDEEEGEASDEEEEEEEEFETRKPRRERERDDRANKRRRVIEDDDEDDEE